MENKKVRPGKDVVSRRVGDEVVLVNLETDHMYSLNATGARAWELLSDGQNAEQVVAALSTEYDADDAEIRREVEKLLEDLEREQLIHRE